MRPRPTRPTRWRRLAALAVRLVLATGPGAAALAGEAPAADSGANAATSTSAVPLAVAVRTDWVDVTPEAVRRAVEDELQSWVVSVDPDAPLAAYAPRLGVEVNAWRGDLTVRYDGPGRKPLLRVIPMPARGDAAIRSIAWLAGNLVRDQASDLLPAATSPPKPAPPGQPNSPVPAPASAPAVSPPVPSLTAQAGPVPMRQVYAPVTFSLLFPLASNADNPDVRTHLSVNAFYGVVGTLDYGVQLGIANEVTGNAIGTQVGAANQAGGDVDGAQLGIVNRAGGHLFGTQAGVVNSAGDVRGAQVGLINVARNVQGVQLGWINISDDINGLPIGIINVSRTGGVHPMVWTSGTEQVALGVKFSTRRLYTLFSGATAPSGTGHVYGPGMRAGIRFPRQHVIVESDLGGSYLFGGPITGVSRADGMKDDMLLVSWRASLGFQLHRHLTLFAGAALTARFRFYQAVGQDVSYEVGPDLFAGVQL